MATDTIDALRRRLDIRELRAALAGRNPLVSPNAALLRLWKDPELRGRERLIRSVLEDAGQPAMVRQTAALLLGKIDRPSAVDALKSSLRIRDPLVRGAVLRALGRIGDSDALARIRRFRRSLQGWIAREADFAITLLAYRHGIEGHEIRLPRSRPLNPDSRRFREIEFRNAGTMERDALAQSLRLEPLGIPVDPDHLYRMVCGPRNMLVVFNRDLISGGDALELESPAALSLVLHRHHHDDAYAPIFYVLTHPAARGRDRTDIAVLSAGGRLCCAGAAQSIEHGLHFVIRAVDSPGNTAAFIEGALERGRLTATRARAGLAVHRARRGAAVTSPPMSGNVRSSRAARRADKRPAAAHRRASTLHA